MPGESGPNSVGTVAGGIYTPFAATNLSNSTNLPLSQLFVQLGSHDRTIIDESLYNQTDLITEFYTGSIRHTLLPGSRSAGTAIGTRATAQSARSCPLVDPPNIAAPLERRRRCRST